MHYYKCDLRSAANIDAVAERIRADVGDPTVVINNAGVARGKPVLEATPGDVRFTFDVNALAPFWTARAFVPSMVARDHGSFVTVSSVAAAMPLPNMVDYAASKAASMSLHEGLTAELSRLHGARRVRTVLVQPSHTNTGLFRGFDGGMDFMMPPLQPQTVAEEVVKKVLSGTSGNIVLPALSHIVNTLRSMPYWYQLIMRASSENMAKWNGHQVIADVDAPIEAGEAGGSSQDSMHSDVGESTVLVSSTSQ